MREAARQELPGMIQYSTYVLYTDSCRIIMTS
jgi:hypothetical protein